MSKENQLGKAQNLLSQALSTAMSSMPNNRSVLEARGHIKQAMNKLDKAQKTQIKRKSLTGTQFENWWGNVQSGTAMGAHAPMSEVARTKALGELDSMIDTEKDKIAEIEKVVEQNKQQPTQNPNQVLND